MLGGGDRRSLGRGDLVVRKIDDQKKFDLVFEFLFHGDPVIAMRALDLSEKISRKHPEFLGSHKAAIFNNFARFTEKEIRWHIAQIIPRLNMNGEELEAALDTLRLWLETEQSQIVKVMSLQALYDLSRKNDSLAPEVHTLIAQHYVSRERNDVLRY